MRTQERRRSAGGLGWALVLVACSFDSSGEAKPAESLGDGTPAETDATTSVSSTTNTLSEDTEGMTAEGGTSTSGHAEASTGAAVDADGDHTSAGSDDTGTLLELDNQDLLVRYYLDEAASGQVPLAARDAAPDPRDLLHDWSSDLAYVEEGGNRGLQWDDDGKDGGPRAPVDGTKVRTSLEGEPAATIEIVADIVEVRDRSRVVAIGRGNDDVYLGLLATDDRLYFRWRKDENAASWEVDFSSLGRRVFHVVLDATADGDERVRLYIDGDPRESSEGVDMDAGSVITFADDTELVLGNRPPDGRSFEGILYYAAIYHAAFDHARVVQHVDVLELDDDAPAD